MNFDLFATSTPAPPERPPLPPMPLAARVRSEPREATREDIEQANRGWASAGQRTRIPASVEAAIREAAEAKRAGMTELRGWLFHPDERVPLALAGNLHKPWEGAYEWYFHTALLARAVQVNQEEGLAWNPLLDVSRPGEVRPEQVTRWKRTEKGIPLEIQSGALYATAQLGRLVDTALGKEGPALVESLIGLKAWQLRTVVAKASGFTDATLEAIEQSPEFAAALMGNRNLTEAQAERMLDWTIERLLRGARTEQGWPWTASGELNAYASRRKIGSDALERLLGPLEEAYQRGDDPELVSRLLRSLAFLKSLPASALRRAYHCAGENHDVLCAIAAHRNATLPLLRLIAREKGQFQVRKRIAERVEAIRDPDIAASLARSDSAEIRSLFLRNGVGEPMLEALRMALRGNPKVGDGPPFAATCARRRFEDIWPSLSLEDVEFIDEIGQREHYRTSPLRGTYGNALSKPFEPLLPLYRERIIQSTLKKSGAEFVSALQALLENDQGLAVEVLNQAASSQLQALPASTLAPLLQSPDPEMRVVAIRTLGRLRQVAAASPTAASPSSPKRRR